MEDETLEYLRGKKNSTARSLCYCIFLALLRRCLGHSCQGFGLLTSNFDLCAGDTLFFLLLYDRIDKALTVTRFLFNCIIHKPFTICTARLESDVASENHLDGY